MRKSPSKAGFTTRVRAEAGKKSQKVMNTENVINSLEKLSPPQQREIVARLLAKQSSFEAETTWKTVRFGSNLRVVSYAPEQEQFVAELREILQNGALARIENEMDGNWEIYGANRTFFVTMSAKREFVGLLSSWQLDAPPFEINLPESD